MKFTFRNQLFDIEGVSEEEFIYKIICSTKSFYEDDLLKYMDSFLKNKPKQNSLAIDVGANIGNHSIFMRSFLAEHLIAIEPNPKVLPILKRNLSENIKGYTLFECGVGETNGLANIAVPEGSKHNEGMAKVSFEGKGEEIKIVTLDSLLDQWQADQNQVGKMQDANVTVMKIDVEGMELSVLKGAQKLISKHKPSIFAEAATNDELLKLNGFLIPLGYKKISRWAGTPVYHFVFNPSSSEIVKAKVAQSIRMVQRIFGRIRRTVTGQQI